MGFVPAKVSDVADIREFVCALPDDVQLGAVADRLAEMVGFPLCGADSYPLHYAFVARHGRALDSHACLSDLGLHKPLELRLVPEFSTSADAESEPADSIPGTIQRDLRSFQIRLEGENTLLHDEGLDLAPDVRIDAEVHREIEKFATQDRYTECAGLVLGTVGVEDRERIIHVRAVAPAPEAEGDRLCVRMTGKAWESALRIKDKDYPQLRTLGWFHTHPGSGVCVSDSDVFVHKHFFPHPNMIAYVLDPTTGRDGFFYWHNGILALRPSYGLVCTVNKTGLRERISINPRVLRGAAMAVILAGAMLTGISLMGHRQAEHEPAKVQVKAVPKATAPAQDAVYTLGPRDNFWKICNRHYNDGDLARALARYNGLRDLSHLQVGQRIKLPPKDKLKSFAD